MKFENTLQYVTFGDKTQVVDHVDLYDTLLLPSHLLAGGQKSVPTLIWNLIDDHDVKYYIDPTVTEFREGSSFRKADESIKQWHDKLINELGEPISTNLESEGNLIFERMSADDQTEAVKSVCRFQEEFIERKVKETFDKYAPDLVAEGIRPKAIIPWYTKIKDYPHIESNRAMIELSKDHTDLPIKPVLHVSKNFISNPTARADIASFLDELGIEDTFLWVDDLNKAYSTESEYYDVIDLVARIAENDVSPQFLYGDYFSNLLYFFGLRGTSYGTYYREHKAEQVGSGGGGGGSLQRYYFNPIKEFINITDAVSIARDGEADIPEFEPLSEWGDLFKEEFGSNHDYLKAHYIRSRANHKMEIQNERLDALLTNLEEIHQLYEPIVATKGTVKTADHLETWGNAIERFKEENERRAESLIEDAMEDREE